MARSVNIVEYYTTIKNDVINLYLLTWKDVHSIFTKEKAVYKTIGTFDLTFVKWTFLYIRKFEILFTKILRVIMSGW